MSVRRVLVLLVSLLIVAVTAIAISTRLEGEAQLARYAEISEAALAGLPLRPHPVSAQYQRVRSFPLMDISVISRSGERLARVNSLDATMLLCMKMYTLMIRPDEAYNLPVLSVDFIFLPFGKRVYVIEVIDPARIGDANKQRHYARMRAIQAGLADLPTSGTRDWYRDRLQHPQPREPRRRCPAAGELSGLAGGLSGHAAGCAAGAGRDPPGAAGRYGTLRVHPAGRGRAGGGRVPADTRPRGPAGLCAQCDVRAGRLIFAKWRRGRDTVESPPYIERQRAGKPQLSAGSGEWHETIRHPVGYPAIHARLRSRVPEVRGAPQGT
jgi:hypothetical protein